MKSFPMFPPKRWRKTAMAITVSLLGLAGVAYLAGIAYIASSHASAPPAAAQAIPVSVAVVALSEVTVWDEFSGRLEAVDRVELRPRVPGVVQKVHFREGALVRRGDLLLSLDPAPYAAEVQRAAAQAAAAQARLANARTEQARAQRLLAEQAIAQREFDERSSALREAEANAQAAQASLQSARLNLDYTQVRAPVSGRVGQLEITVGNQVAAGPGAPVLTTLVSVSPIYASFDADEEVVAKALGARSKLDRIPVQIETIATGEARLQGHLQLIDNQVNAKSGTVRMRAVFDNQDGSLLPGQFVRVRMGAANRTQALLVSERAVGSDQSKRFVWVVGADNRAEYRQVQLGAPAEGMRIVTAGLKPGERIVVNGLQRVRPGALVAPQVVGMRPGPEAQATTAAPEEKS